HYKGETLVANLSVACATTTPLKPKEGLNEAPYFLRDVAIYVSTRHRFGVRTLFSSLPLLRQHQSAWSRNQNNRDQAFSFKLQRGFTDSLQVRAGIVHDDGTVGIDLRQVVTHFLLTDFKSAVAEQQVNRAFYFDLQAGFISQLNPLLQAGAGKAVFGLFVDLGIIFAGDDFPEAVLLESFSDPERADSQKRSGFQYHLRLDGGDQAFQKFQNLHLGCHG